MIDHPVLLFSFTLVNVLTGCGFLALAFAVINTSTYLTGLMRTAGTVFSASSAAVHFWLAASAMVDTSVTSTVKASMYGLLALHMVLGGALWVFLLTSFMARWNLLGDEEA